MTERRECFVLRGTRRLFVVVRGEGPALLFSHGLAGTHVDTGWLSAIADGFTLVTPDHYGRGASAPGTDVDAHTFTQHALDVAAILDHLEIERAIVGGTSFGAAVATAFAVAFPQRVRALILLACAFGPREDSTLEGDLDAYRRLADRMDAEGVGTVAEQEAERSGSTRPIDRWTQHHDASLVAWMRAVPLDRPIERLADLQRVTAPVLVVPGGDAIHRPELSRAYAAALPNATLAEDASGLAQTVSAFLSTVH